MEASPGVRSATERDIPRLVGLTRLAQDLHVAAHPDVFRPSSDLPGIDDFFSKAISDTNLPSNYRTIGGGRLSPPNGVSHRMLRRRLTPIIIRFESVVSAWSQAEVS